MALSAAQGDALRLEQELRDRHLPYGLMLDPIFHASNDWEIVNYTRCGDSAIWTGHYLAAQAFRYAVTQEEDQIWAIHATVDGIERLVQVTGTGLLARCTFPESSPFAQMMMDEERGNGSWNGAFDEEPFVWIGNTSRDQYSGVFFGLHAAWELTSDDGVRTRASQLVTTMLEFLLSHDWSVVMPDGRMSTTFAIRPDQQLSLLRVGARMNPERFADAYRQAAVDRAGLVSLPVALETLDTHGSYFKFNLDYIHFWNLLAPGDDEGAVRSAYQRAYGMLRRATESHGNAHFNLIDRAINGADEQRDSETRALLEEWLTRPRRDFYVSADVPACGPNRACEPIPVAQRVNTDFLWQRSPFQLSGGGGGLIEPAGIDYLLPYWMGRYYGVLTE